MKITFYFKVIFKQIKNKSFIEIKELLLNNQMNLKNLNYYKDTLYYIISNHYSFDIIKYFKKQRHQYPIDNTDILFNSVEYQLFDLANLLLRYGKAINGRNKNSQNIIEYLVLIIINSQKFNIYFTIPHYYQLKFFLN